MARKKSAFQDLPSDIPFDPTNPYGLDPALEAPTISIEPFQLAARSRQVDMQPQEPAQLPYEPPTGLVDSNGVPSALTEPTSYEQLLNNPEYKAKLKELADRTKASLDEQKAGLAENQADLKKYQEAGQRTNWAPGLNALDQIFGTKTMAGYAPPPTPEAQMEKLMTLKNLLQTQRQGMSKAEIDMLKSQIQSQSEPLKQFAMMERLNQRGQAVGIREDEQAANAAKSIHNNKLIEASTKQIQQIGIDRHTIETSPVVTSQILHEISNGIANALSGGRSVGLGMSQMQDLSTAKTRMAEFETFVSNNPREATSPAVKKQVIDTLNRLEEAFSKSRYEQAQRIQKGKKYLHSQQARDALQEAVDEYSYIVPENTQAATEAVSPIKNKVNKKAIQKTPELDVDLSKMNNEELKNWMSKHGQ